MYRKDLGFIDEVDIYIGMTPLAFTLPKEFCPLLGDVYITCDGKESTVDSARIRGDKVYLGFNELEPFIRKSNIRIVANCEGFPERLTVEELEAVCYALFWRLWNIESYCRHNYNENTSQPEMLREIVECTLKIIGSETGSKNFREIMSGKDLNV